MIYYKIHEYINDYNNNLRLRKGKKQNKTIKNRFKKK